MRGKIDRPKSQPAATRAVSGRAAELRVRVQPRAGANEVGGVRDGAVVVRVTAPPEDGRANELLRKVIARRLRVGVTRVTIVRGPTARDKVLRVEGVSSEELKATFGL